LEGLRKTAKQDLGEDRKAVLRHSHSAVKIRVVSVHAMKA
jgi:hypothetical protein